MSLAKRKVTPKQVAAIKMRQREIISEFNRQQVTAGRGRSSLANLGEPFEVKKSPRITEADLMRMQREAGFRG